MRIGIDLGGTKIEGIVLSGNGEVVEKRRVSTPMNNYEATVRATCELVNALQPQSGSRFSVGVGTPGALSLPAGIMKNCNSVNLNGRALKNDIEQQLGHSIRLENDANCFALSEAHLGAAKTAGIVFGVIIGTGTGGGIVVNKQLLQGPNAIAGEWGHNPIPVSVRELIKVDRECYCGRKNCIETILSGRGLSTTFLENVDRSQTAAEIAELAQQGDMAARECINLYCDQLARCLATVVNIIDPEMIVLGGGLSNIPALYSQVIELMRPHVFTDVLQTTLTRPSFGDASGALGAACLWPDSTD